MASYFEAFRAERRVAPTVAWESTSDPCSDDDSDAADFAAMRRKTKAISQAATERGCLPAEVAAAAARKAKKQASCAAFKNLETLAEAAGALVNILSPKPEQQNANGKIWQALKSANLVPTVSEPGSVVAAASLSTPQAASERAFVTSASPPKSSAARRHSDAVKAARCPETFSLFAEEEQAAHTAAVRESSLARGYDALGAQHFALDDGADSSTMCGPSRASSITRGYDALEGGASTTSLASSASSEKKSSALAPVRPPSRGQPPRSVRALRAAQAMPVAKASSGAPSAMELDVGLSRAATPTLQKCRPESPSLHQATRASSRHSLSAGTRLPKLPVAGGKKGSRMDSMSGPKVKPGAAASATLWDVPPLRHSMDWNTRSVAF